MSQRRGKIIIGALAVAAVYGMSAYAICGDAGLCRSVEDATSTRIPGQLTLALLPAAVVAFILTVDAILPVGRSVLDMASDAVDNVHTHLFVEGHRNNYWHLRVAIALGAIVAVQLLTTAVECLHGG